MILYFEIERNSNKLGLLERSEKGTDHYYIQDKSELQHDKLYYLFFREKNERTLSPVNNLFMKGEEESKKVII